MPRRTVGWIACMLLALLPAAASAQEWVEGKHYFLIRPAQRTEVAAGKIEVAEAFSYGCIACDRFHPLAEELQSRLPPQAQFVYVPASFNEAESWPLFQRAYLAAKALGIAQRTHAAMFAAVWQTGELAVVDEKTRRLKSPQPTLEQVAAFYARTARITPTQFLESAQSFSTAANIKRADAWIRACRVDQTPTFVVNGKYRLHAGSAGGVPQLFALIDWLVKKESGAVAAR
jgi:protein dithiol oxidoreductase (disulfide-forming)